MATTTTIRPFSLNRNDGYSRTTASTGATSSTSANVLSAVNDNSLDTYLRKDSGKGSILVWWNIADPSPALPSTSEFLSSVTLRCRMSQGSAGYLTAVLYSTSNRTVGQKVITGAVGVNGKAVSQYARSGATVTLTFASNHNLAVGDEIVVEGIATNINGSWTVAAGGFTTTTITYTSGTSGTITTTSAPAGSVVSNVTSKDLTLYACPLTSDGLWTQTRINDLSVALQDATSGTSGSRPRVYEVMALVTTSNLPAFGAAPTISGATTTTRPTVNLGAYSQADSFSQNGVQVRVFTATKTDPSVTSDLVWDSGIIANTSSVQLGAANSAYPSGVDLTNGTTYYVFARTAADSSGTGNMQAWSAWGSGTATSTVSFTLSLTAPTTTSLTATWNSTTQTVALTATGAAYASGTQVFEIQRSNDGGTTYYPVRGASTLTPDGSYVATATDYEAARGATVRYRWRAVGTVSGQTVASAWTSAVTVTTTVTSGGGWTLRSLTSTGLDKEILGARVLTDVPVVQEESIGVFRPLGRSTPIVIHGDLEKHDGSWTILAQGTTEWTSLIGVINSQRLILCLDPFGGYKYVRVTNRDWNLSGVHNAPRYELRVGYVEVEGDLPGTASSGTSSNGGGYTSPDTFPDEEI